MIIKSIEIGNNSFLGINVPLKGAPLLFVQIKDGGVGCRYFSEEVADKVGTPLAVVSGEEKLIQNLEDLLEAKVIKVTEEASKLGVEEGISGEEAIKIMAGI